MKKPDKKALKSAGLITVIALVVFEAVALLVQLVDPEGGLLRVDLRNPVHPGSLPQRPCCSVFQPSCGSAGRKNRHTPITYEITDDQQSGICGGNI